MDDVPARVAGSVGWVWIGMRRSDPSASVTHTSVITHGPGVATQRLREYVSVMDAPSVVMACTALACFRGPMWYIVRRHGSSGKCRRKNARLGAGTDG
jgi:hypothetical protein